MTRVLARLAPERLAIVLPNWIGDVVMATPMLRAVREQWPAAQLVGVLRPYVSPVLDGSPWLDERLLFDPHSTDRRQRTFGVARALRERQIDTVLLLTNSLRAAFVAWWSGARTRIGFVRNGRGGLLTHKLYAPRSRGGYLPVPAIDYYLQIAQAAGCFVESRRMELATTESEERLADRVGAALGLTSARRLVLFNTGGAKGAAKDWPREHFVDLARRTLACSEASIVVLCGPNERETAAHIERAVGDRRLASLANPAVLPLIDRAVGLGLAKALVRRSSLLVTTDSGPRHFAHAFDVPVITLYGPTDPAWTEPYHARSLALTNPVPCGPCARRVCPLGHHRCLRDLSVDRVFRAVAEMLESTSRRAA